MTRATFALDVDDLLRARRSYAPEADVVPIGRIVLLVVGCGFVNGAVMGSFDLRPLQMLFSGLKVPLLLLGTSAIVLPNFFVLNTLLGLRADFAKAARAVFAAQAVVAVTLAALAPFVLVLHASTRDYALVLRVDGALFCAATLAGHVGCGKFYRQLVRADRKHWIGRIAWTSMYVFVGIQLAWVSRPFVGSPDLPTTFTRADAWTNAYVQIAHRLLGL